MTVRPLPICTVLIAPIDSILTGMWRNESEMLQSYSEQELATHCSGIALFMNTFMLYGVLLFCKIFLDVPLFFSLFFFIENLVFKCLKTQNNKLQLHQNLFFNAC